MNKYGLILVIALVAIIAMLTLGKDIEKKEAQRVALSVTPEIPKESMAKNEEWAKYYPRQYDSWKQTRESDEIVDMLEEHPQLPIIWAGYGFSKDYNAPRGHMYTVQDLVNSLRTGAPTNKKDGPMPTACWTCKSPDVPRLMDEKGELEYFTGKWSKYGDEVTNPLGCGDCHDPKTMELAMNRPYLDRALESAGKPVFADSTHQEKRSLVCAQCHNEYYFQKTPWKDDKGVDKVAMVVTNPWKYGFSVEGMEKYYDEIGFADWTHKISKTPMLKAQHPGYEIASTGIHYQKGVSCADCHMPYTQEGAVKYSDHHVQSPLESMDRSCMNCHREKEEKLKEIVYKKYERKEFLSNIAMDNIAKAHLEAGKALELGAKASEMKPIQENIRHAQWRWDYAIASHGSFFHAPEETLRVLGSANELAQQARLKLIKVLAAHGAIDYSAPDFSTKEKAQKLAGLNLQKMIDAKMKFKATLEKEWLKTGAEKGSFNPDSRIKELDTKSSYFNKEVKK